jgi:hypothetical protein
MDVTPAIELLDVHLNRTPSLNKLLGVVIGEGIVRSPNTSPGTLDDF